MHFIEGDNNLLRSPVIVGRSDVHRRVALRLGGAESRGSHSLRMCLDYFVVFITLFLKHVARSSIRFFWGWGGEGGGLICCLPYLFDHSLATHPFRDGAEGGGYSCCREVGEHGKRAQVVCPARPLLPFAIWSLFSLRFSVTREGGEWG